MKKKIEKDNIWICLIQIISTQTVLKLTICSYQMMRTAIHRLKNVSKQSMIPTCFKNSRRLINGLAKEYGHNKFKRFNISVNGLFVTSMSIIYFSRPLMTEQSKFIVDNKLLDEIEPIIKTTNVEKLKMDQNKLSKILTPNKSDIILLEGTTMDLAEDFPNKIKKVYFEHMIDEVVQMYGYEGGILHIDVVCELENGMYAYYKRIDDWRYDTSTVQLVIGATLNSVLDNKYVSNDIKEEVIHNSK